MERTMNVRLPACLVLLALGCSGKDSPRPCGLSAVVGPSVLLSEFSQPGQTLATPPARLPEQIVVRLVAGPAFSAIAGRADSQWVIGVNGTLPTGITPGYGVLTLDLQEKPLGVLLYEGAPIDGAPVLGTVTLGALVVPLIGIRVDPQRIQEPGCPLFPDSLAR
jgi:hypothetical protein